MTPEVFLASDTSLAMAFIDAEVWVKGAVYTVWIFICIISMSLRPVFMGA